MSPLLEVLDLEVSYHKVRAIQGVSLSVSKGEIVAVVGPNGAGKTTLLTTICNLKSKNAGQILFDGVDISNIPTYQLARRGLVLVPEGRGTIPRITVEENLIVAGLQHAKELNATLEEVYTLFPRLKEKRHQMAGSLSGGEQQMLAIGRGLMSKPVLMMLDEPSMGLAPVITQQLFELIIQLRERGISILLVEQNARSSLQIANRGYILAGGRVVLSGTGRELLETDQLIDKYLGHK